MLPSILRSFSFCSSVRRKKEETVKPWFKIPFLPLFVLVLCVLGRSSNTSVWFFFIFFRHRPNSLFERFFVKFPSPPGLLVKIENGEKPSSRKPKHMGSGFGLP